MGAKESDSEAFTRTIERPLPSTTTASAAPPSAAFTVTVVEADDSNNVQSDVGKLVTVDETSPSRILIGQGPVCALRLTDPHVSRRHAALELFEGSCLRLTDLGSKNGTSVNGIRIADAFLMGGETVRIGGVTLRVEQAQGPPMSTTAAMSSTAMRFARVIGSSPEMRRIYPLCEQLASSNVPVVLEGETGTGKEQLAEALHESGPRAQCPFIVFDCTAVPASLLESALFGHERGAFTGATSQRKGVFEQAHTGTLLIDEIGDLELSLQPKLLRALQRGEVQRIGSDKWMRVDVRVLAATRRDLDKEVQEGRFRDDLFYRLAVARIELPPLRRRRGDVALLARHFWRKLDTSKSKPFPEDLIPRFEAYEWPGNVRELFNAISRHLALGNLARLEATRESSPDLAGAAEPGKQEQRGTHTGDFIDGVVARDLSFPQARADVMDEFERRYIEHVLARYGGSVAKAAAASGIARRYFQIIRSRQTQTK